jgi:hypothetical protein
VRLRDTEACSGAERSRRSASLSRPDQDGLAIQTYRIVDDGDRCCIIMMIYGASPRNELPVARLIRSHACSIHHNQHVCRARRRGSASRQHPILQRGVGLSSDHHYDRSCREYSPHNSPHRPIQRRDTNSSLSRPRPIVRISRESLASPSYLQPSRILAISTISVEDMARMMPPFSRNGVRRSLLSSTSACWATSGPWWYATRRLCTTSGSASPTA